MSSTIRTARTAAALALTSAKMFAIYFILPDFRHPVRYALRRAGIERTPTERPAAW